MKARHTVPSTGPNRRLPGERSRLQEEGAERCLVQIDGREVEEVADVALLHGCYFFQMPQGAHQGEWVPIFYVQWMKYCNPIPHIRVPEGENAALARGADNLLNLDVECFIEDEHEVPCMLHIDQVQSLVYYQNGYHSLRAGDPDFYWVDTLWEKL